LRRVDRTGHRWRGSRGRPEKEGGWKEKGVQNTGFTRITAPMHQVSLGKKGRRAVCERKNGGESTTKGGDCAGSSCFWTASLLQKVRLLGALKSEADYSTAESLAQEGRGGKITMEKGKEGDVADGLNLAKGLVQTTEGKGKER